MGKVIEGLERIGSDATLRHADTATLDAALRDMGFDDETRLALLSEQGDAVQRLLGDRPLIVSQMQSVPDGDVEWPDDDGDDDAEDDGEAISRTPVADESL